MPYKFFIAPIQDVARVEAELNAFVRSHTVPPPTAQRT